MGTDKRARQKELHKTRLEEARREAAAQNRRRRLVTFGGLVALAVVAVLLIAVLSDGDDDADTADGDTTTTVAPDVSSTTTADGLQPATLVGPGPGGSIEGDTPCPTTDGSQERTTSFENPPPMCIDESKAYSASFATTKGTMIVELDVEDAPQTVNNFVVLSRYKFYDGSPFFRIVPDFAAQFGDPSESPSNSAQFGYTIPDELPGADRPYQVGSLAMTNTGQPDSGGAQMFFVTGAKGVQLPQQYALFGQVTEGLDVLAAIGSVPSINTGSNDGAPTEQVTIESITITER